jgi:hypothetical protein
MRTSKTVGAVVLLTLLSRGLASGEDATGLQALIDKAPAGGEVTVPKGEWKEPLRIDKPLTLRGEDRDACVVDVVSDRPAIWLSHKGEGVLENLTIRWRRQTSDRTAEPAAAVVAKDTALVLRNVRIAAPDNPARCPAGLVAVGFCDVKVERCEFDGFDFTIEFGRGAKGSVTDSVVTNPGHCGITAGPDSTVHVARTIVTGSRYHGIRCTGGELTAEHNLVIANKNRGFYLGNKSARGTIRDNVIQDNGSGISGFAETEVKVHNNFIAGSDFAAVDMRDSCRLDVDRNLLANNTRGIVLFRESGNDRNTVGRNASAGNKAETEGFETAPELQDVEGGIAPGEFATDKASGFGVSDPAVLKPLWERWTELQKTTGTE